MKIDFFIGEFSSIYNPRQIFKSLTPNFNKMTFIMDASDHQQYGLKTEVATFGYKKFRCVSSQMIFDELPGLNWLMTDSEFRI